MHQQKRTKMHQQKRTKRRQHVRMAPNGSFRGVKDANKLDNKLEMVPTGSIRLEWRQQ